MTPYTLGSGEHRDWRDRRLTCIYEHTHKHTQGFGIHTLFCLIFSNLFLSSHSPLVYLACGLCHIRKWLFCLSSAVTLELLMSGNHGWPYGLEDDDLELCFPSNGSVSWAGSLTFQGEDDGLSGYFIPTVEDPA